jgi:hypothetical protein
MVHRSETCQQQIHNALAGQNSCVPCFAFCCCASCRLCCNAVKLSCCCPGVPGTLPNALSNGSGASSWDLISFASNDLNGTLPSAWSALASSNASVNTIDVSGNLLNGSLPSSWAAFLAGSSRIRLQGNYLAGSIPPEWAAPANTSLAQLLLQDNACMCGPLPSWFSHVPDTSISTTNLTVACVAGAVCSRVPGPARAHPDVPGMLQLMSHDDNHKAMPYPGL